MADIIISSLLNSIFENLNSLVLEELGIASGLKKELESLQSTLSTIQAVLGDAEAKKSKSEAIQNWLRKLKDAVYDADNVLDDFSTECLIRKMEIERGLRSQVSTFLSLRNPLIFRFKMGHKIKNIKEKLDAIAEEKNKFHLNVGVVEIERRSPTSSLVTESEIYGRVEEKEKIIKILLNNLIDDLSVFAICGMGGLGKTTLAQLVYNDKSVQGHFELKIWVCVSDDFDILRLTRAIIESIEGGACNIENLDPLQRHLQEKLSRRRFLLVLDDVWNEYHEKWDGLKVALKCGAKGSTVLVTTRLQNVARVMATHPTHHIGFLSEGDSWSLFKQRAFGDDGQREENLQLETIGMAIMEKCGGVPLAIKALGSLMRLKSTESEWRSVKDSEIWDLTDDGSSILPALRLSYDNLPQRLRQCFAYCCIFPKDWKMEKDLLILLWMANGFIQSRGHMTLYELGLEIFNDLVWRSFLQDVEEYQGGVVTCKMHDFMHDLAQSIVRHECCFITKHSEISEKIRHLCAGKESLLMGPCKKEDLHKVQSLRSLVLLHGVSYESRDIFYPMLSKHKYLRVLIFNSSLGRPPTSINHLKHLRYLDFSYSSIKTLPESTTCLQNLQSLKLRHCVVLRVLPRGMKYMRNLRYLDIRDCCSLIRTPPGLGRLTCLQTLSIFIVGQESGHNIGELKRLELQGELSIKKLGKVKNLVEATSANLKEKQNLVSLDLSWEDSYYNIPDNVEEVLDGLRPHPNLKNLGIKSYKGSSFPIWLMDLALQNLVKVSLVDCHMCENLPPFGKLPFLEVLYLTRMNSVKYFNNECYADGWNAFPALRSLTIEWCPKLMELPFLPAIKRLHLSNSSDMLPRFVTNLTSLTSLTMSGFHDLNVISCLEDLNSLDYLFIGRWDNLSSLPENGLRGLSSLRELHILCCKKLESLSEGMHYLTALQNLNIYTCPEMKSLPDGMQQLKALQTLTILECEGLYSLPSCLGSLPSLAELLIYNCQNLTSLPDGLQGSSTLKYLHIIYCPVLVERCKKESGEDWPKIAHIPTIRIDDKRIQ